MKLRPKVQVMPHRHRHFFDPTNRNTIVIPYVTIKGAQGPITAMRMRVHSDIMETIKIQLHSHKFEALNGDIYDLLL